MTDLEPPMRSQGGTTGLTLLLIWQRNDDLMPRTADTLSVSSDMKR